MKVETLKRFMRIRDKCKNPKFEKVNGILYSKGDEYQELYKLLDETGNLDVKYIDNLKGRNGYELAGQSEKLTFKDCCTVLTFILRAERWTDGAFGGELKNGNVYALLSRACEELRR